jgi:branched-chain amino acid transport system permease protein
MSSERRLLPDQSGRRRWWVLVAVVVVAVLPFVFQDSYWRTNLIVCAINVMLAVGLDFILGYAGQLNLGHSAFYGIGAYASTLLIIKLGVPFWIAFAAGMVLSGIAGMALSLFAVRLRGHYLAIASLGFAVIVHQVLLNWISLTQGPLGIYAIKPPPDIALPGLPAISFSNLPNMFYLVAGFALFFYLLLDQLVRSPIGETLAAIREDEVSASSFGINCTAWKVFSFGIGSALAGAAGAFYASFVGTLVPDAFIITESFTILAMVIVGGMGTLIGPVWGAILLTVLPELLRGFGDLRLVVYGAALTLVVLFVPGGLVQAVRVARASRQPAERDRCRRAPMTPPSPSPAVEARGTRAAPLFCGEGLHKRFGGVQAVRDISLNVPHGSVFAIIGPNGAGKSTLLNLMSGLYQPDRGRMIFDGSQLVGLPAYKRARLGLARTFQKLRLFKQLSVVGNVIAASHIHHQIPAWQYVIHGVAFTRDHARCRAEADKLLRFVGLEARSSVLAASLAYGEQRMLELARALATSPRLLMLDEPAAGLNAAEVERLLERIRHLRQRGMTIVVVEHNMDLVMKIADRVLVMDYGEHLFEGAPAEVQANPTVIAAYLGA